MAGTVKSMLVRELGPGFLSGITLSKWCRLLWQNRFRISPRYWPRAAIISMFSVFNSASSTLERWRDHKETHRVEPAQPVFVIGIARSGTTLLQNLLSRDPQLAHLSVVESRFPLNFRTIGPVVRLLLPLLYGQRRAQDSVHFGPDLPAEEEGALASMSLYSHHLAIVFPHNRARYTPYRFSEGFNKSEREEWIGAYRLLVRRLCQDHDRSLVLKNPGNTTRIRLLQEAFPGARFIYIHRHPYDVIRSTAHTSRVIKPYWRLQNFTERPELSSAIRYGESVRHYLENRKTIPEDRLVEVGFEDLERDPVTVLRHIYAALNLSSFEEFEPHLRSYLEELKDYRKNRHEEISESTKELLAREFPEWFQTWGYRTRL